MPRGTLSLLAVLLVLCSVATASVAALETSGTVDDDNVSTSDIGEAVDDTTTLTDPRSIAEPDWHARGPAGRSGDADSLDNALGFAGLGIGDGNDGTDTTAVTADTTGALLDRTEETVDDADGTGGGDTGASGSLLNDATKSGGLQAPGPSRPSGTVTTAAGAPPGGETSGTDGGLPSDGLAVGAGAGVVVAVALFRQGALSGLSTGSSLAGWTSFPDRSTLDRLVRLFAPFRYSRYDDSDPLEHEARERVYQVVESDPGAYLSAVSDRADLPLSTARHHVRVLEREGLVVSAKVRGKRRFYPGDTTEMELAAAMDDEPTEAILDALVRHGPCSVAMLADELDRDSSTVTHHLQRLAEDELIVRERDGRSVLNRLAAPVRRALDSDESDPVPAGVPSMPADD